MTFVREYYGLRPEFRQNTSGNVFYWYPKVGGLNVDATVGSAIYNIYTPGGSAIASGSCTQALDSGNLSFAINMPLFATLGEDYQIRIDWVDQFSSPHREVILFDVVLYPWQESSVSLNSLQEIRADVGEVLERMGSRLALSPPAETYAGIIAQRARVELDAMLRDQIARDSQQYASTSALAEASSGSIYIRPRLIMNRERLDRVERLLAMQLAYAADMAGPDSDDESASLFRHYKAEAEVAFRSMGALKYDRSETLQPTAELSEIGRVVHLRRVQG
jgi:hypothetical protein